MAKQEITNNNKKILSFQPFSIYGNGGGPRIMRRLVEGRENEVKFISFDFSYSENKPHENEIIYVLFPRHRDWMRSFLRKFFYYVRNSFFYNFNVKRVQNIVAGLDYDVLHILDHSAYSNILLPLAKKNNIPIWVSFHDHFNTTGSSHEISKELWQESSKRMVISEEMGQEYSNLFGPKNYTIVSDGLKPNEISPVKTDIGSNTIKIYFGGLLHVDYYELFDSFCKAIDLFSKQNNKEIVLILRGTQKLSFLENSSFKIEYRPFSIDNELLRNEMDGADILYLPIKYNDVDFYKFSFSTKMIGYLGASGNIFYHGPESAAAALFLKKNNCGVICDSLDANIITNHLNDALISTIYSTNAKEIANNEFQLKKMQDLFFE